MDTAQAYRECERITWSQARNFAYGIRLLPPAKRHALAAVYAFARRIDDIGDGALPAEQKIRDLEKAREAVGCLSGATADTTSIDNADPVLTALTDVAKRFAVPMAAFGELIDGCIADVRGTAYETLDDLLYYCQCVAGSVGRLSLGIFRGDRGVAPPGWQSGATDPEIQEKLANELGLALQLTNILRDVREDYQRGRVYLPAEDLATFGCELDPAAGGEPFPGPAQRARFAALVEFEAERARERYATGMRLLPTLDRRSAACTGAMAGIYRRLLERIAGRPSAVLEGRVSLSAAEKALVAAHALAGMRHRPRRPRQPRDGGDA
ncbi:MAG: squalene/phytoene synthase family protein [Streptosporangiaceae bacterium]|nr:squalene/phytoene synthase family protein [Streptosporangiaceae bacterium]MBV9854874.1 squalene/phytoene synthase family protein [Streptosporangiaceae bacterium]